MAKFTPAQCEAFFAAVLVNDQVDTHTELPETISLDYSDRQLLDCFSLCRQLWKTGVDRREMIALARKASRHHDLDPQDRLRLKYARAKFKQLRFAYGLYSVEHRYPEGLDRITRTMGDLQDAIKHRQIERLEKKADKIRWLFSFFPQRELVREIDQFQLADGAAFRRYVAQQIAMLRAMLGQNDITGAQFHEARKIVSRQVSFYDSLRTIQPSGEAYLMSRSLSAINGLMGQVHDELVEQRAVGTLDYHHERFALPDGIRQRLSALAERYPY